MKQKSRIFAILAIFTLIFSIFSFSPVAFATEKKCYVWTFSSTLGGKKNTQPLCFFIQDNGTLDYPAYLETEGVQYQKDALDRNIFGFFPSGIGSFSLKYEDKNDIHEYTFYWNKGDSWGDLLNEVSNYISGNIEQIGENNEYVYMGQASTGETTSGNSPNANSSETGNNTTSGPSEVDPEEIIGEETGYVKISSTCNDLSRLSWLACPLAESLAGLSKGLYEDLVEPALLMETNYVSNTTVSSVWGTFRDISNILLAVLILVVVISQVTGIGIDNYGIKKILPKIIVAALLINLSYFICEISVDLSNIVGKGIMNLFVNIESSLPDAVNNGGTITAIIGGLIGSVITLITLPILNIGMLLSIILGLFGFIISVFFLFLLLTIRKAGIVALVIISPLAFAAYMLPNTKSLFNKWTKFFSTLLLLFPICGLIMGASTLIASIFMKTGDDSGVLQNNLIACIIAVAPAFLIPSVVKSSFAVFGKAGAALAGFGRRFSSGVTRTAGGAIRSSQRFKEIQGNQERRREAAYAERRLRKLQGQIESGQRSEVAGTLNARQQSRLDNRRRLAARLAGAQRREEMENISARESQIMNSATADQIGGAGGLEEQLMNAIIRGDDDAVTAYQNVLSKKGDEGRQAVHNAMLRAEGAGTVSSKTKKTYASNIMNNWASDYKNNSRSTYDFAAANAADGTGGNISTFTNGSIGSLKQEQLVAMDDAEIGRYLTALENGTLSPADASRLRSIAAATLANGNLASSLKGSRRRVIEQIAAEPSSTYVDTRTGASVPDTYRVLDSGAVERYDTGAGQYVAVTGADLATFQQHYRTVSQMNAAVADHYINSSGQDIGEFRELDNGVVQINDAGTFRNVTDAERNSYRAASSMSDVVRRQALDEAEAVRRGKVSVSVNGTPTNVYAPNTGNGVFHGGGTWSTATNGDAIYTEKFTNPDGSDRFVNWNGSTGRYTP